MSITDDLNCFEVLNTMVLAAIYAHLTSTTLVSVLFTFGLGLVLGSIVIEILGILVTILINRMGW